MVIVTSAQPSTNFLFLPFSLTHTGRQAGRQAGETGRSARSSFLRSRRQSCVTHTNTYKETLCKILDHARTHASTRTRTSTLTRTRTPTAHAQERLQSICCQSMTICSSSNVNFYMEKIDCTLQNFAYQHLRLCSGSSHLTGDNVWGILPQIRVINSLYNITLCKTCMSLCPHPVRKTTCTLLYSIPSTNLIA